MGQKSRDRAAPAGHFAVHWKTVAAGAVFVVLGGCSGPVTSPTYQSPDSRFFAQSAMVTGPMLVRIGGRPYDVSEEQLAPEVLEAMQRAMSWTATPRLTTDPALAPVSSMVIVLSFNMGAVDANVQCSGNVVVGGGPQPEGAVQVAASFCGSGTLISNTSGHVDRSSGPNDPMFSQLITQVTQDLFPQGQQFHPGIGLQIGGGGWYGSGGGGGVGIGLGF